MSELRNREKFEKSIHSFEWIRDAAPGATDLDCFIGKSTCALEYDDAFLLFEGKEWHANEGGVSVPRGQHRALSGLARLDAFTVFLVGECEEEPRFRVLRYGVFPPLRRGAYEHFPAGLFYAANEQDMQRLVRKWRREAVQ